MHFTFFPFGISCSLFSCPGSTCKGVLDMRNGLRNGLQKEEVSRKKKTSKARQLIHQLSFPSPPLLSMITEGTLRLFRETKNPKKKSTGWETVASNLEEMKSLADSFEGTSSRAEKALQARLREEIIEPAEEKILQGQLVKRPALFTPIPLPPPPSSPISRSRSFILMRLSLLFFSALFFLKFSRGKSEQRNECSSLHSYMN